jgi:hypothetical protein
VRRHNSYLQIVCGHLSGGPGRGPAGSVTSLCLIQRSIALLGALLRAGVVPTVANRYALPVTPLDLRRGLVGGRFGDGLVIVLTGSWSLSRCQPGFVVDVAWLRALLLRPGSRAAASPSAATPAR